MKKLKIELSHEETDTLLRFLGLVLVNLQVNPDKYSFKADELKGIFEYIDDMLHTQTDWCQLPKNECSWWIKQKKRAKKAD